MSWRGLLLVCLAFWQGTGMGAGQTDLADVGGTGSGLPGAGGKGGKQKQALEQWAASMVPEKDYNASQWQMTFHSRSPSDFFDKYCQRMSKLFQGLGANVNFVMIGACDGTNDPTIRNRFIPSDHWRGVFVEPMSVNYNDLVKYLNAQRVGHRSYVIRGAATSVCHSPTIMVERPLYEEKNASLPHWLRRQIGAIVPSHRVEKFEKQGKAVPARSGDWVIETVRCVTATDVLTDWANTTATPAEAARQARRRKGGGAARRRRPHVLKIDVEGHDYDVLMSFVRDVPTGDLPLLIEFEAKSIGAKFPAAKIQLEQRGYIVSKFAADGFALLRGDKIFRSSTQPAGQ